MYKVIVKFKDKVDKYIYNVGDEYKGDRVDLLLSKGFIAEVKKSKQNLRASE